MAVATLDTSLPALLASLQTSLNSALEVVPDEEKALPPKDGISLLDVKNELLLSYLQNLVFLIILKIRNASGSNDEEEAESLNDQVVRKLVELRVYLEKGVRPLENKLKYQIDKVLRAADDAARASAQKVTAPTANGHAKHKQADGSDASEASDAASGSESSSDEAPSAPKINDLAHRPNPSAFTRPAQAADRDARKPDTTGVYRPPRINATAMPTTTPRDSSTRDRPLRSAAIDEFITEELSAAPLAQPSIGSDLLARGRHVKSARERAEEAERTSYEESNFVRLPKESKKDAAKKRGRERNQFGGEEWRGLEGGLDRIERIAGRKGGGGAKGVLERSRKRAVEDSDRGSGHGAGVQMGEAFAKRRKMMNRRRG